jgi:hypothetical protein
VAGARGAGCGARPGALRRQARRGALRWQTLVLPLCVRGAPFRYTLRAMLAARTKNQSGS